MAKEIPYFKFYIGDWSNGDITLETYELQGIFINVCSYYWSKDCSVSLDNVKKKFREVSGSIDELIKCNCIKKVGENISISFLNEQMDSKEVQKAINRNNGSKGGRPSKEKTEDKPNGLIFDNQNITNIEKSKEEEIREEDKPIVGLDKPTAPRALSFEEMCDKFIKKFNQVKKSKYQKTDKVKKALKGRLGSYTGKQIIVALTMALKDPKHKETNFMYITPEFILRSDILERYLNLNPTPEEEIYINNHDRGAVLN